MEVTGTGNADSDESPLITVILAGMDSQSEPSRTVPCKFDSAYVITWGSRGFLRFCIYNKLLGTVHGAEPQILF